MIDEDLFSLAMYEQQFRNLNCTNVQLFDTVAACVNRFDEQPKIIFLDYRINPQKGLKLLTAFKKIIPHAYIIFIAGPGGIIELLFSLQQGAFEYIIKDKSYPDKIKQLLKRIEQIETIVSKKPGANRIGFYYN